MGTALLVGLGGLMLAALIWVIWELRSAPFEHELWPTQNDIENKTAPASKDGKAFKRKLSAKHLDALPNADSPRRNSRL